MVIPPVLFYWFTVFKKDKIISYFLQLKCQALLDVVSNLQDNLNKGAD